MTRKQSIIAAVGIVVVIVAIFAYITLHKSSVSTQASATPGTNAIENYVPAILYNGGYYSALPIQTTSDLTVGGAFSLTGGITAATLNVTGTSTLGATTTANGNVIVTTSNSATSTLAVGCIQTYATSTATAISIVFSSVATSSPTYGASPAVTTGLVGWTYGKCPKI